MSYKVSMLFGMEPKTLKEAPFWWLVTINYLSSFFVAGLAMFAVGYAMYMYAPSSYVESVGGLLDFALFNIGYLLILWLTTWNASRFLRSKYVIPNPKKLVRWTLLVAVLIMAIGTATDYLSDGFLPDGTMLLLFVLELAVFYYFSKKYLRA